MSLDGNFGLVHKRNSGTSHDSPQLASTMFFPQAEVDQHVDNYTTVTKKGGGVSTLFILTCICYIQYVN